MPRIAKPVSSIQLDILKAGKNIAVGNGLHMEASKAGLKSWFVRYRRPDDQRGKVLIGYYPDIGLSAARVRADEIHLAARTGEDIIGIRQQARLDKQHKTAEQVRLEHEQAQAVKYSFNTISAEWLKHKKPGWAALTYQRAESAIEDYLQPAIGKLDMRILQTKDVIAALTEINTATPATARKCRQYIYGIVDYCIARGIRGDDSMLRLKGIFPKNRNERHHHAITDAAGIGPLWLAIKNYSGSNEVRSALQLCAWTAARPGVIASTPWSEIDLDAALWTVPAARMKMKHDHVSSLPNQALAMLQEGRGNTSSDYVFPAVAKQGSEHIHRDSLSKALREMGFQGQHVTHGWRASFRTVARERLKVDIDLLETQLAHAAGDRTQQAYDRAKFIEQRAIVMQTWADWLDEQAAIAAGGNVTQLRAAV